MDAAEAIAVRTPANMFGEHCYLHSFLVDQCCSPSAHFLLLAIVPTSFRYETYHPNEALSGGPMSRETSYGSQLSSLAASNERSNLRPHRGAELQPGECRVYGGSSNQLSA